MTQSYSEIIQLNCPSCGNKYSVEAWLVINASEYPEFIAKEKARQLHNFPCPLCGYRLVLLLPIAIYDLGPSAYMIHGLTQALETIIGLQESTFLNDKIQELLGRKYADGEFSKILVVSRENIVEAIEGKFDNAILTDNKIKIEAEKLNIRNPEKYQVLQQHATRIFGLLDLFVNAPTKESAQEILYKNPEFIDGNAINKIIKYLNTIPSSDINTIEVVNTRLSLLQNIQQEGGDAVYTRIASLKHDQKIVQLVQQIYAAGSNEIAFAIIMKHPELLGTDTEQFLTAWSNQAQEQGDARSAESLLVLIDLLKKIRRDSTNWGEGKLDNQFLEAIGNAQKADADYAQTYNIIYLELAIDNWEKVLTNPEFNNLPPSERSEIYGDVGGSYLRRYWAKSEKQDVERALELRKQAMNDILEDSPREAFRFNGIGVVLQARYDTSKNLNDLEEAISCYSRAVKVQKKQDENGYIYLNNFGGCLIKLFDHKKDPDDLNKAIATLQSALKEAKFNSPYLFETLSNLARGFESRYSISRNIADLDQSINYSEQALNSSSQRSRRDKVLLLNSLALKMISLYKDTNETGKLQKADEYLKLALSLGISNTPEYLETLSTYAMCQVDLYLSGLGTENNFDEATSTYKNILSSITYKSPKFMGYLADFGTSYIQKYRFQKNNSDLFYAIKCLRFVSRHLPEQDNRLPLVLSNLGMGLSYLFELTGGTDLADEAILVSKKALNLIGDNPLALPGILNNLGNVLLDLASSHQGNNHYIDESIKLYEDILGKLPLASNDWIKCANKFGDALYLSYDFSGHLDQLDKAILLKKTALEKTSANSPERYSRLASLAECFRRRYYHLGDISDLEASIVDFRHSIKLSSSTSLGFHEHLSSLGNVLLERYSLAGAPEDLDESITLCHRAIELSSDSPISSKHPLANLGNALTARFKLRGNSIDLEEAISVLEKAIGLAENDVQISVYYNSLGACLLSKYELSSDIIDLVNACDCFKKAINYSAIGSSLIPIFWTNQGQALTKRFEISCDSLDYENAVKAFQESGEGSDINPGAALLSFQSWSELTLKQSRWEESLIVAKRGLDVRKYLYKTQLSRKTKESQLTRGEKLTAYASYSCAKLGRLDNAVEIIEAGRWQLMSEALSLGKIDIDRLNSLNPNLARRYYNVIDQIEEFQFKPPNSTQFSDSAGLFESQDLFKNKAILQKNYLELEAIISEIQMLPEFEDFMEEMSIENIRIAAIGSPIVYMVISPVGGMALLVERTQEISVLWLDKINESLLHEKVIGDRNIDNASYLKMYIQWFSSVLNNMSIEEQSTIHLAWCNSMDNLTKWLWDMIMGPLISWLKFKEISSFSFVPTGLLGLLPIHAAWTEDETKSTGRRYAIDDVNIVYIPNARSVIAANSCINIKPKNILAVDNPDGSLSFSSPEIASALLHFPLSEQLLLGGLAATREMVLDTMSNANVLHFSTHGIGKVGNAIEGGLFMANNQLLTLEDIVKKRLQNTRLAILSACETSKIDIRLPDEVISLPTGLLQAGIPGVIGSLWIVQDVSTMMLIIRFYDLWMISNFSPDKALQGAQIWLRDTTNLEKINYFSVGPQSIPPKMHPWSAHEAMKVLYLLEPDEFSYSHPFFWAGFSYTGI